MNANEKGNLRSSYDIPIPEKDSPFQVEFAPFPVLYTKLSKPPLGEDFIVRTALIQQLEKNRRKPLILVLAAAGSGKSATVSQWIDQVQDRYCWLSLDEEHNDLRIFLSYLLAAVRREFPGTLFATGNLLEGVELPAIDVIVHTLINDLDQIDEAFIIVLDDYHAIQDGQIHQLMNKLVQYPPQQLTLVLISRRDPPLLLARLRAQGRLAEIRMAELSFTPAETDALARLITGSALPADKLEVLTARTEGWITGLRLVLLGIAHGLQLEEIEGRLQSDLSLLSGYLLEEVILKQPEYIQQGLLATAVLERFCPKLVAAVLADAPGAGQEKELEFIPFLIRSNLYVIPLDRELEWFRYHHLFQHFLRKRLAKVCTPGQIAGYHRRASTWFAEQELLEEAIRHMIAAGDIPRAVDIIDRYRFDLFNKEQFHRLNRWLGLFPAQAIEKYLPLILTRALAADAKADYAAMERDLAIAGKLLAQLPPDQEHSRKLRGEFHSISACFSLMTGNVSMALEYAQQALELLTEKHTYIRDHAMTFRAVSLQMTGRGTESIAILDEELRGISQHDTVARIHLLMIQSIVFSHQTNLPKMEQAARGFQGISQQYQLLAAWARGAYYLSSALYLKNELEDIEHILQPLFQHRNVGRPLWIPRCYLIGALTLWAQGKVEEMERLLADMHAWAGDFDNQLLPQLANTVAVELALRREDVAGAWELSKQANFDPFPPIYFFHIPQLTQVKLWMRGDAALVKKAEDRLEQLLEFGRSNFNDNLLILARALQSVLYHQTGRPGLARQSLREALAIGEAGGHIRTFADLGSPMETMIRELSREQPDNTYLQTLLDAFEKDRKRKATPPATTTDRPIAGLTPLSDRELEILQLVAEGYRNTEIAEQLFLSLNTVKGHLYHLYQKLDVNNRINAVAKARDLGLIQGT